MSNEILVDWHALEPKARMELALRSTGPFFVTGDDNLQVSALASTTNTSLMITGRFMQLDGEVTAFQHSFFANSNRTLTTIVKGLGNGWILNLTITTPTGTPAIGQCWVRVQVIRGLESSGIVLATLASGYVTAVQPVSFPGGPPKGTLDGPGNIRVVTGTNPAIGAEISETVPAGAHWRLFGCLLTLATGPTVANRTVLIIIDDGAAEAMRATAAGAQAASATTIYSFGSFGTNLGPTGGCVASLFPDVITMLPGWRLRTTTAGFQADDDYSAPALYIEEWLQGA